MLSHTGVNHSVDRYGLGCVLYEMVSGFPPFYSNFVSEMLENIRYGNLSFPKYVTKDAQDLISRLLDQDPCMRPELDEVKEHPFFDGVNWEELKHGIVPDLEITQFTRSAIEIL